MTSINIKLTSDQTQEVKQIREFLQANSSAAIRWAIHQVVLKILPELFASKNEDHQPRDPNRPPCQED